jgi:hypothetical protein
MKQQNLFLSILAFTFIIYTTGCETKKDPFSARNQAPQITAFFFRPDENPRVGKDSLEFISDATYRLHLEYNDAEFANSETQTLEAVFKFINGSGTFSHDDFEPIGETALRFKTPPTFNDDLQFIPDTSGLVRIELTLTDGVKTTDPPARTAPTVFFLPLVADLQVTPSEGTFPLQTVIDATGSRGPAGGILAYEIFIDGQSTYNQSKVTHVFETPKSTPYQIRLQVTSSRTSLTATANASVLVRNTPPVADFTFSATQVPGEILFTSTSTDPDSTDMITNYRWKWGDGTEENSGSNLKSIRHRYGLTGEYSVILVVTDRFGATDEKEQTVTVK